MADGQRIRAPQRQTPQEAERRAEVERYGYRNPSRPQPGFFAIKLVRGGPEVAAALWYGQPRDPLTREVLDRSLRWRVFVAGQEVTGPREPEDRVLNIWVYGRRLSGEDYQAMLKRAAEAPAGSVLAEPERPIDLMAAKLPF